MLENNDLAAISASRLNNKNFIDDPEDRYSNFSITKKKKATAKALTSINTEFAIDEKYKNDCNYLNTLLKKVQNSKAGALQKSPSKAMFDRWVQPLVTIETKIKDLLVVNNCAILQQAEQREIEEKNTLDVLQTVANTPPSIIATETQADKATSNLNKYIIYGVGALILIISGILLLKPSK